MTVVGVISLSTSLPAFAREDTLTVTVTGNQVHAVELTCRDGTRVRARPEPGRFGSAPQVQFSSVPDDECTLFFKGTTPGHYSSVPRDGVLHCVLDGRVVRCGPDEGPSIRTASSAPETGGIPSKRASSSTTAPPSAPLLSGASGDVEIVLDGTQGVTGFQVACRHGHRQRMRRETPEASVRFVGIPADDDCRIYFLGTPPAVVHSVAPGVRLECFLKGVTAVCSRTALAASSASGPATSTD